MIEFGEGRGGREQRAGITRTESSASGRNKNGRDGPASLDYFSLSDFYHHAASTSQRKRGLSSSEVDFQNAAHTASLIHQQCQHHQHQHHHSETCNTRHSTTSASSLSPIAAAAHARATSLSRLVMMKESVGGAEDEGSKNSSVKQGAKRSRRIPFLRTLSLPGGHATKAINNILTAAGRSKSRSRAEDELRKEIIEARATSPGAVEHYCATSTTATTIPAKTSGTSSLSASTSSCAPASPSALACASATTTRTDRRLSPNSGDRASPTPTSSPNVHHASKNFRDNTTTSHQEQSPLRPLPCSALRFALPIDNNDSPGRAMQTKIWVKRPGASATRVTVNEDDLVDNVRDVILDKYANSLGKTIDSPDIALKILSREPNNKNVPAERVLGPEESIGQTLDALYPGGQTIEEALVIEIPSRRTPRPSPRVGNHQASYSYYAVDNARPDDGARDYFPPMPLQSPHLAHVQAHPHPNMQHYPTSMAVLTTGQLPPLPSPGAHSTRRHGRPKYTRQHTSSPTILHSQAPNAAIVDAKGPLNGVAAAAPTMPTPPAQVGDAHKTTITPPNRTASPHGGVRAKRKKNVGTSRSVNGDVAPPLKSVSSSVLNVTVPPINVLIVEDNVINLKLLEKFMIRLRVRWKSAMNGREAVDTWRQGGFHLILMDIQLPIMNGLEATKEIRRLEAVNNIGVFSGSPIDTVPKDRPAATGDGDILPDRALFKSPVIIVALTASSLQSDRHAALAAGCNDFLTKPVIFSWMERKVTEWGCMQALIDFDGWKKWKELADEKEKMENEMDPAKKAVVEKEEKAKTKAALKAMFAKGPPATSAPTTDAKKEDNSKDTKEKVDKDSAMPSMPVTGASTPMANGSVKKSMGRQKSARPGSLGGGLASMPEEEMEQTG